MKEDWKYQKIYELQTSAGKREVLKQDSVTAAGGPDAAVKKVKQYGHGNTGKAFIAPVLDLNPKSLLDVGCGYNEFCYDLVRARARPVPEDDVWQAHLKARMKSDNVDFMPEIDRSKIELPEIGIFAVGVDCACPGADVIASAAELPFCNNSFEIITSFDCMEHIAEEEIEQVINELHRVSSRHIFLQIDLADHGTKIDGETLHVTLKEREWWNEMIQKKFKIEITHEFYTSNHPGTTSNINGKAAARMIHKSTEDLHVVKGIKI
jgi:SAM-dependent methyltransferase|tara:strand:- start:621 stop:1415 length:795 start_codon:yes stop_codon:yes gene_type:complete